MSYRGCTNSMWNFIKTDLDWKKYDKNPTINNRGPETPYHISQNKESKDHWSFNASASTCLWIKPTYQNMMKFECNSQLS